MFHLSDYLSDLETVVNIDSNSADPAGLLRVADAYARIAERFGLSVRRVRLPEQGADLLMITNHGERDRYDVLMMGHMDTVRPTGAALETPFSIEGDVAHGPGICDMKAGTLAALYIYDALPQAAKDALDIVLLFNPDEELSSRWSQTHTRDVAARTDYAFVLESSHEIGKYTYMRKGSATYRVVFHGVPGHAGYIHTTYTANAVLEMARWGLELHHRNDPAALLSVNVASMHGGGAVNVVPDEAELKLNIRVASPEQFDGFEKTMADLAAHPSVPGVTAVVETVSKKQPMTPAPGMDEWLERIRRTMAGIGQPFELYPIRGGCSDGNVIAAAGTRVIDSIGPLAEGSHTCLETLYIAQIEPCIARLTALIEEIFERKKEASPR